jgi:CHAD domain-containing protein
MSGQLGEDETIGNGIRRIACQQVESAITASSSHGNGKDSPVHETRKHLKEARAALQLLCRAAGRERWRREDRNLRNIGRLISEIRDAEVRLQTVKQLRKLSHQRKNQNFRETEELLAFELDSFLAAFSDWQEEAKTKLTRTRDRIADWPVTDLGPNLLYRAIQRSYKSGRKSLRKAMKQPSPENFHDFRKRAKQLFYQLRILRWLNPLILAEFTDELRTIGQNLGHAHDLAFLMERLSTMPGGGSKRNRRVLASVIDSREKELQQRAITLGQRFYAQRSKKFAARVAEFFLEREIERLRSPTGTVPFKQAA